jgi:hypothetical protein
MGNHGEAQPGVGARRLAAGAPGRPVALSPRFRPVGVRRSRGAYVAGGARGGASFGLRAGGGWRALGAVGRSVAPATAPSAPEPVRPAPPPATQSAARGAKRPSLGAQLAKPPRAGRPRQDKSLVDAYVHSASADRGGLARNARRRRRRHPWPRQPAPPLLCRRPESGPPPPGFRDISAHQMLTSRKCLGGGSFRGVVHSGAARTESATSRHSPRRRDDPTSTAQPRPAIATAGKAPA